jgi:hypothetical protein
MIRVIPYQVCLSSVKVFEVYIRITPENVHCSNSYGWWYFTTPNTTENILSLKTTVFFCSLISSYFWITNKKIIKGYPITGNQGPLLLPLWALGGLS